MIFGYGWCHPFLSIIRRDNNIYEYYFLLKPAKKKASVNCVFFVEWSFVPYLILCTEKVIAIKLSPMIDYKLKFVKI